LILGQVDYNNQVTMPQVEMARQLGMKRQNVSRAVAVLIKEEVLIVEEPQLGRNRRLRLNDRYGWKGKLKNLRTQRKSTSKSR
jgi:DNA-binding MarR family transcriptional regulator